MPINPSFGIDENEKKLYDVSYAEAALQSGDVQVVHLGIGQGPYDLKYVLVEFSAPENNTIRSGRRKNPTLTIQETGSMTQAGLVPAALHALNLGLKKIYVRQG